MLSSEEREGSVIIDRVYLVVAEFNGDVCFWRGHPHEAAVVAKHEFENEYADEIEAGVVKFLKVAEVKLSDDLEVVGHADQ